MKRYLDQLAALKRKHKCPVVYAGDIFDKWNSPPELINFAIRNLPPGLSIPGQHDLPCHAYEDVHKSAYHTLCEAGVLTDMRPGKVYSNGVAPGQLRLYPFPWGHEVTPLAPKDREKDSIHVAVVHAYCWYGAFGYPGAEKEKTAAGWQMKLQGYDGALFGDNHKGFMVGMTGELKWMLNHGAFMPVKSDERDYVPKVGLLLGGGAVKLHPLDVSQDKWVDTANLVGTAKATGADVEGLLELFQSLGDAAADFGAAVTRYCTRHKVPKPVQDVLRSTMEEADQ